MTRYILSALALSLVACGAAAPDDGLDTIAIVDPSRGEQDSSVLGRARLGDCSPEPLRLDPAWSEGERELLRQAAVAWQRNLGVDLGPLPEDAECSWNPSVAAPGGCILRADYAYSRDVSPDGIRLFIAAIETSSLAWGVDSGLVLRAAAKHEMGHWIGIGHLSDGRGVMAPRLAIGAITQVDIDLYSEECA